MAWTARIPLMRRSRSRRGRPGSVHLGDEGAGEVLVEDESAGEGWHERAGDPRVGAVAEGHPEAGPLPLHAPAEDAVGAADDPVGLEEQAGADRVGEGGDQGRAALEAGQGVLLDGQRVEPGTKARGLGLPFRDVGVFSGEVGLPERYVADTADAEDDDPPGPL